MSMTVLELREYVREHLDSDTVELPDTLLDVYRNEGTTRIEMSSQRWSFYETEVSLSTTANDQTYPLADLSTPLKDVLGVEGPQWRLDPLGHENARERFASTDYTGRPRWYSLFAQTLYLWPTPSAVEAFTIRGYRGPTAATGSSEYPDLPSEFHPLIGQWMLARAYQQFDDDGMADKFFGSFEGQLSVLRERYESPHRGGVSVMGGKDRGPVQNSGRLRYSWE